MKIEPTPIAAASLIADDTERQTPPEVPTPKATEATEATESSEPMRYEDLLPWLLLPMAGAY
jgi:hypothetical protein